MRLYALICSWLALGCLIVAATRMVLGWFSRGRTGGDFVTNILFSAFLILCGTAPHFVLAAEKQEGGDIPLATGEAVHYGLFSFIAGGVLLSYTLNQKPQKKRT
jgi:hypothetical protein